MLFFANTKDKRPSLSQSSVVYKFTCPDCSVIILVKQNRLDMILKLSFLEKLFLPNLTICAYEIY